MDYIYVYGRYAVILAEHTSDQGRIMPGYGVLNTETDVIETTTTMLFNAIKWCRLCEIHVKEYEKEEEPSQEELWPQLKTIT